MSDERERDLKLVRLHALMLCCQVFQIFVELEIIRLGFIGPCSWVGL